jgi:hypothetical protein
MKRLKLTQVLRQLNSMGCLYELHNKPVMENATHNLLIGPNNYKEGKKQMFIEFQLTQLDIMVEIVMVVNYDDNHSFIKLEDEKQIINIAGAYFKK